jgi:predicted nucleic acid-binding protein
LLRGLDPIARDLFVRIEAGEFQAYMSVLTFDELAYRMLLALAGDKYDDDTLDRLKGTQAKLIKEFYPDVAPALARLRTFPNLVLMDVTSIDLTLMDENMTRYHLRPRDALLLSAMQKCGCYDLVSHHTAFDQVPKVKRYTLS